MGLLAAQFETEMVRLYVPQHSQIAKDRTYLGTEFGSLPKPGVFLAHRNDNGNVCTRRSIRDLFALHNATTSVRVQLGLDEVDFRSVCARRFIPLAHGSVCMVMSPLYLWECAREKRAAQPPCGSWPRRAPPLRVRARQRLTRCAGRRAAPPCPLPARPAPALPAAACAQVQARQLPRGRRVVPQAGGRVRRRGRRRRRWATVGAAGRAMLGRRRGWRRPYGQRDAAALSL